MNLEEYKRWYVIDEGHWYTSKVKQYKPSAIQEFAKGLAIIEKILNAKPGSNFYNKYIDFRPPVEPELFGKENLILINDYSILYICLHFLNEDLINLSHLQTVNPKKFILFSNIQKEFLENKDYNYFEKTYSLKFLKAEFMIYYRNFKSWLSKFGFYGEYKKRTAYFTEMGIEFINNCDDIEICSALFSNQIKKFQIWNPTIDEKYREYKVRPYYLLLDVVLRLPGNYFTKIEHALFITKIKSHNEKEIVYQIELIKQYRKLHPEARTKYLQEIERLDRKLYTKKIRIRTNLIRLLDSATKEIDSFTFGSSIEKGSGRYRGSYHLANLEKAKEELDLFTTSPQFIEFSKKLDWVTHLGSKNGVSIEIMIDLYLESGMSMEHIKNQLLNMDVDFTEIIEDKIYEKEIESYYVNNIKEIDPNLEVITDPNYGRQFSTSVGPIDILCIDQFTGEYVVCELKRGQTSDETLGQILRYMGWVYFHLAETEMRVRGILIGSEFDEKIDYSFMGIQDENIYKLITKFKHPFSIDNKPLLD